MKNIFFLIIVTLTLKIKPDICPEPDGCNPCTRQRFYINPVLTEENTKLFCCPEKESCICIDLIN